MTTETFHLSALHPALAYGDGQFTAFASDLGWGVGEVPDAIDLFSPKSGRTITFVRSRKMGDAVVTNDSDKFFYRPSQLTTPARFSHLSILIFND